MPFHHGVTLTETQEGARFLRDAEMAVIGMVVTADDADADYFPLNTPVLITGDITSLNYAGTTGTLRNALDAIFDQGAPVMVVVRVAESESENTQNSNVIGTIQDGVASGLQALLTAKTAVNVTPRILGCPGLDTLAVASELAVVANKLRAFAYVYAHDATTKEQAVTYRDNFDEKRLMVLWPKWRVWDTDALESGESGGEGAVVEEDPVARALGLRAYLDTTVGWHKSLSNVPVQGVMGVDKPQHWDLRSPNTAAGYLNANEVTCLVHEEGYRYWGNRTTSTDPNFAFECWVRTGDFLGDTIADGQLWAIDKPMTRTLVYDVVETINAKIRELKATGRIVDGKAWIPADKNTAATLKAGLLYIDYDYVAIPPLEHLDLTQRINDTYLIQLVS